MRFNHNIKEINRKLIDNMNMIVNSKGTTKAYHLQQRIDLIREKLVYDIQLELQQKIDESHRIYTDDKGSFFDDRYDYISYSNV